MGHCSVACLQASVAFPFPLCLPLFLRELLSLGLGLTLNPSLFLIDFSRCKVVPGKTLYCNKVLFAGSLWIDLFLRAGTIQPAPYTFVIVGPLPILKEKKKSPRVINNEDFFLLLHPWVLQDPVLLPEPLVANSSFSDSGSSTLSPANHNEGLGWVPEVKPL